MLTMNRYTVLIFVACLASVSGTFNFTLNDCLASNTNALLRVNSVSLNPSVIHLPGQETGSIDVDILRNISGNHYQVAVQFSKSMFGAFIDVPCTGGFGSCTYDLCTFLKIYEDQQGVAHCPPEMQQSNFPCTCPIMAGHYSIPRVTFQLYQLSPAYSAMASGDFKIHIKITDQKNGDHVGCFDVLATVDPGCSGLSCLIGRK